ncbi:MAG: hypothetical protein ACR2MY_04965 [Candidatus Dormibacteria bacterium]
MIFVDTSFWYAYQVRRDRRHDEAATSFAVMRRRRIREALAFDGDFGAAGFIELGGRP